MDFSRFTDRSRRVLQLAKVQANRFNHECIGTSHLLLGLIAEGHGVAANVLKNLELDDRRVRLEVEKIITMARSSVPEDAKLPYTPRAMKVLQFAVSEATDLNHNYVGTEHLLLGLLRVKEGSAAQVLERLGLLLEDVRDEVMNLVGCPAKPSAAEESLSGADQCVDLIVKLAEGHKQLGQLKTAIDDALRCAIPVRGEIMIPIQKWLAILAVVDPVAAKEIQRFAAVVAEVQELANEPQDKLAT